MLRRLLPSSFALGLAACTASPEMVPSSSRSDLTANGVGTCTEVDAEEVEHACIHGSAGPFRPVKASTSAPPDVSRPHTTYRVELEALDAEQFGGAVAFLPAESGEYAIYASADVPEIQVMRDGEPVAYECSTPVPTNLCGALRRLRVADLEAGKPVALTFLPSTTASVVLVIEHREHDHDHDH
jgi:hypothetical protein